MNLSINGTINFNGIEVKNIEGGFREGEKTVLSSDVARIHNVELKEINQSVQRNLKRFTSNDLIDLMEEKFKVTASDLGLITSNGQKHLYLFSERGYIKLVSCMSNSNEKKWEVMDKFIDEYFKMRKVIKEIKRYERKTFDYSQSPLFMERKNSDSQSLNFLNNAVRKEVEAIIDITGIKATFFAKQINISDSNMSNWRNNLINFSEEKIDGILNVLDTLKGVLLLPY